MRNPKPGMYGCRVARLLWSMEELATYRIDDGCTKHPNKTTSSRKLFEGKENERKVAKLKGNSTYTYRHSTGHLLQLQHDFYIDDYVIFQQQQQQKITYRISLFAMEIRTEQERRSVVRSLDQHVHVYQWNSHPSEDSPLPEKQRSIEPRARMTPQSHLTQRHLTKLRIYTQ